MTTSESPGSLVVTAARLRDGSVVDMACADGVVTAVVPAGELPRPAGVPVVDAAGGLVTEPFVDAHLHLDKVRTLPWVGDAALQAYTGDGMADSARGIDLARAVKEQYSVERLLPAVRQALADGERHGVLHVQAFADVDTAAGLVGVQAVLAAREEFRGRVDVAVVAFPQDGLLRDPGAGDLVEEALALGADVVGGIPWLEETTADQEAHVEWACALAARLGRRVAMLTDDAPDPSCDTTRMLAEALRRHGLQGRGVACHARALGHYDAQRQTAVLELAREVGLGLVSDPHTGSVALPVERAVALGVDVALGQDDIEDAYYPFGRHNLLEVAFLAAHLLDMRTAPQQEVLVDLVTTSAARVLGLTGYGLRVGGPADLLVHDAARTVDLLAHHAAPRVVVRGGVVLCQPPAVSTPATASSAPGTSA
ncbi:amidohydrolase family protein [Modestobacter italicus]|uniref:amidohydrolase family protein n=1 Tax=Modestobacter italicus (strain DSM 44449 / CECT 9708 / BC 501) TaxID=2732864 RepID=UPI0002DCEB3B|nr:amidohydrolase family protein [Modestobacter marinus]